MKAVSLFVFVCFLHTAAAAQIKVQVHFSPIANLVYQLDCISGALARCSQKSYQNLWDQNFIKSDVDRAKIKAWGELMNRYQSQLELSESKHLLVSGRFQGVDLSTKIRIASFQSQTKEDYASRLDLVVIPRDRERFEDVIRHFYPRFDQWWKSTAQPQGKSFAQGTETLLKSDAIASKIRQFARFFAIALPQNYIVHLNLFYRADFKEATSATQLENYALAEFLASETPEERIDVIVHELCHFFLASAPDEKMAELQKNFEASGKTSSRSAYNLLDETLATALGNGIINKLTMKKERWERYSTKEHSFYSDPHIDRAAKSILPWIETWLNEDKTLFDTSFVKEYLSSLENKLGHELMAPRLVLKEMVLVVDNEYKENMRDAIRSSIRASSIYSSKGKWSDDRLLKSYRNHKNLSALLIVHPSHLNHLQDKKIVSPAEFKEIKRHYQKNPQIIYSFMRTPTTLGYLIVATDEKRALSLVETLGSMKQGFEGIYRGP